MVKRRAKENARGRLSKLIRSELAKYHAKDITTHDIALARKNIYVARRDAVPKLPTNQELANALVVLSSTAEDGEIEHSELSGGSTGSCQRADDCPLMLFVDVNRDLPLCTEVDSFGCMLWLYMKLFSLMGITWLTEIISWAVGGPSYYWYVTDIVNILRAVFVFIIFCCKRTTLNIICVRLHGLMPCCTTAPVMTYGKENSSSQRTGSMQLTMFNNARKTSTPKTEIQNSIQPSL
uniref:Uncharacterized protein n=1 Tax=Timema genevievae TaxID=629358 RepID=A0A7R9K574_TIMGE|nr:unnamed protein product [Timema genevievae]